MVRELAKLDRMDSIRLQRDDMRNRLEQVILDWNRGPANFSPNSSTSNPPSPLQLSGNALVEETSQWLEDNKDASLEQLKEKLSVLTRLSDGLKKESKSSCCIQ